MKGFLCAMLLAPAVALAQPSTADDWYKQGETEYNLGNFDKAAEAFKQGFALEPDDSKKPAYLYNVAQAYRQGNRCKDAAFFYKRYLSMKEQDTQKPLKPEKRAEIEQRIAELEECAKNQATIASKPPTNTMSPNNQTGTTTKTGPKTGTPANTTVGQGGGDDGEGDDGEGDDGEGDDGEGEGDGEGVAATVTPQPKVISARFIGGGAKVSAGELEVPILASFALVAGYPVIAQDKLEVDIGAAFGYQPVPFKNSMTNEDKTASFTSLLVNAAATYTVAPKIGLRGDLGAGLLAFGGIGDMGNPFTENGAGTSGTLAMFALRVGVSADYAITPNLVATVAPITFSYSPAKTGLREDITSITRLDFMLGIGYRM